MRIYNKLDEILDQGAKIKILRFLFTEKDEYTGRGIAKAIGMSASATYNILQDMKKASIIGAKKKGNSILYKLREENYFVKKLLATLFEKEKGIYRDVISSIKKKLLINRSSILSIAIFGSVAINGETPRSDMDLLIVVQNSLDKNRMNSLADKLIVEMAKTFGIALSPYILTKTEMRNRYSRKQKLILSILKNNRLVYGEPIERILA